MAAAKHGGDYGQRWAVASALIDGAKTEEQIGEHFRIMARRFGFFFTPFSMGKDRRHAFIRPSLEAMHRAGWAVYDETRHEWELTDKGRKEAEKMLDEIKRAGSNFRRLMQPQAVSRITFLAHLLLSLIKLPAALLSGSVALLNDALDTMMDALSSVIVYVGIRAGREQIAAFILLFFMVLTGGYAMWESISRFAGGATMRPDWITLMAVGASAFLSAVLYIYQRYTGVAAGSMPIIAQSIDSRNHLLVAAGVGVSFLASWLGWPLLDLIIGVAIALMILKGALDLLLDMLRQRKEGQIDLSAYGFQFFEKHRHKHMTRWFLAEIDRGKIRTREQLYQEAVLSLDFEQIPQLQALGMADGSKARKAAQYTVGQLFEEGYVGADPQNGRMLYLTDKGEKELRHARKRLNRWHGKNLHH